MWLIPTASSTPRILRRYLRAYQEVQPLTIGELWAVAITLRIVLIENLRRIAKRIADSGAGRRAADALADRLLGAGSRAPEPSNAVLPQHAETTYPDAFLVHLAYRLRDQDPSIAPALEWLDQQLARQGTTADAVIHDEHQRQVTSSVTVRNIITSMRLISDVDWTELFERVSLVDEVFTGGNRFAEMDFPTRNLYRTAVEQLARGSGFTELEVAEAAVVAARHAYRADAEASDARLADPGYYLIAARPARFRGRDWIQTVGASMARALLPSARNRRLCQRGRGRRRGPVGHSAVCRRAERRGLEMAAVSCDSGTGPGDRRSRRARQPRRDLGVSRYPAAGAGTARRNSPSTCARSSPYRPS